jgi:hypothetical protein
MNVNIRYGKGFEEVKLPDNAVVLKKLKVENIEDGRSEFFKTLESP